jgi:hypothetical protein
MPALTRLVRMEMINAIATKTDRTAIARRYRSSRSPHRPPSIANSGTLAMSEQNLKAIMDKLKGSAVADLE